MALGLTLEQYLPDGNTIHQGQRQWSRRRMERNVSVAIREGNKLDEDNLSLLLTLLPGDTLTIMTAATVCLPILLYWIPLSPILISILSQSKEYQYDEYYCHHPRLTYPRVIYRRIAHATNEVCLIIMPCVSVPAALFFGPQKTTKEASKWGHWYRN